MDGLTTATVGGSVRQQPAEEPSDDKDGHGDIGRRIMRPGHGHTKGRGQDAGPPDRLRASTMMRIIDSNMSRP